MIGRLRTRCRGRSKGDQVIIILKMKGGERDKRVMLVELTYLRVIIVKLDIHVPHFSISIPIVYLLTKHPLMASSNFVYKIV